MPILYDELVRLRLKPGVDFEFNLETDSLMRVHKYGVAKLVNQRFWVAKRGLHISMIPDDRGVVIAALASLAAGAKRPGFWQVVLDASGRPVAEHPLKWTTRTVAPDAGSQTDQPPTLGADEPPVVETTGAMTRMLVSWMIGFDRVNDDASAAVLEILSVHAESPREVTLPIKTRGIAQRLHDEVICFIDDAVGIPDAVEQASKLAARVALLLTEDRV